MSNYNLVLEIIETFENYLLDEKFRNEFKPEQNVTKEQFYSFCEEYINGMSSNMKKYYKGYIDKNWKYIESGGDDSVFDF